MFPARCQSRCPLAQNRTAQHGRADHPSILRRRARVERAGTSDVYGNPNGTNVLYCFYWKTFYNFVDGVPLEIAFYHDGELESISYYNSVVNGEPRTDIIPFGKTQVIVITDLQTGEVILTGPSTFCEPQG